MCRYWFCRENCFLHIARVDYFSSRVAVFTCSPKRSLSMWESDAVQPNDNVVRARVHNAEIRGSSYMPRCARSCSPVARFSRGAVFGV